MNTFGATSPGPRPVAEMPANRNGDAGEARDDGGNPFGAVLGALNGASAESAPASQPARPGRRDTDGADTAPGSEPADPLGLLAAVAAAPVSHASLSHASPSSASPSTGTMPAAVESTGRTGRDTFESLVARAVPDRPAGPRTGPEAVPAADPSFPSQTAFPTLADAPGIVPAPDPSVPADTVPPAIQPSATAALAQVFAPAQAIAPEEPSASAVRAMAQSAAASTQARTPVTVLRQETHFAPVMPRSLGAFAAVPAPVPSLLPGVVPSPGMPLAPQASQPLTATAPGSGAAVSPAAAIGALSSQPVTAAPASARGEARPAPAGLGPTEAQTANRDSASGPVIEAPADSVEPPLGGGTSALRAASPSLPASPVQPAAGPEPARSASPPPAPGPAIEAPANPAATAPGAASALPAASPSLPASPVQPAAARPATEAVPAPAPLAPGGDAAAPVRSGPALPPGRDGAAETPVAPRHIALAQAESDEVAVAGRAAPGPGADVLVPQPALPMPASSLVSAAPSSAPVRQIAEAVAAEAARAAPAQAGALPGQPGSEGPLRILTLQLRPMDLGNVVVRMRLRGSQLEMSLHANRAETADLLRKDGALLGALLRDAGYHPDTVTIGAGPAEPSSGNASASGQTFPSGAGGHNPGRDMSDQPARRQPATGTDRINDARERTNETNPAGPDRSGVYL